MGEIKVKIGNDIKQIIGAYALVNGQVKELLWECVADGKIKDFIQYFEHITKEIILEETTEQNRDYRLIVENSFLNVQSLEIDNGKVKYSMVGTPDGLVMVINVTDGVPSKTVYNSQKYTKIVSDYSTSSSNSFPDIKNYNDGSYSGTLNKDGSSNVISGSYTPADSKEVTGQDSPNYNSGGYSGTLSSYVYSGTPSQTKEVTGESSAYYNDGVYSGMLSQYVYSGSYIPSDKKSVTESRTSSSDNLSSNISYNQNGYSGTLTGKGVIKKTTGSQTIPSDSKKIEVTRTVYWKTYYKWNGNSWYRTNEYSNSAKNISYDEGGYKGNLRSTGDSGWDNISDPIPVDPYTGQERMEGHTTCRTYSGWVTRDAYTIDTYEYSQEYEGTVTKPEIDTRVWKYRGTVTKPDTRVYKYRGTVYKNSYDTRIYQQKYTGNVHKGGNDDYYKYKINIKYTIKK